MAFMRYIRPPFVAKPVAMLVLTSMAAIGDVHSAHAAISDDDSISLVTRSTVNQPQPPNRDSEVDGLSSGRLLFVIEQGAGKARTSYLVMAHLDGSNACVLAKVFGALFNLTVSHDGQSVVFTQQQQSFPQLWRLDIKTGQQTLLSPTRANYFSGSLSPDKQQLLIAASLTDNPEIFLTQADGSEPQQLTYDAAIDIAPQWLSNQQGFVFISDREGLYHPQIYRYDFASQQTVRLTHGHYVANPKISPDGQWLSYIAKNPQGIITRVLQRLSTGEIQSLGSTDLAEAMTFSNNGHWGVYSQDNTIGIVDLAKLTSVQSKKNNRQRSEPILQTATVARFSLNELALAEIEISDAIIREPQLIE